MVQGGKEPDQGPNWDLVAAILFPPVVVALYSFILGRW